MNVLLVEDDEFKKRHIVDYLERELPDLVIRHSSSVHSAKKSIKRTSPSLILMDMSLPTFDISADEPGGRPHPFGGRELLAYMQYKKINIPVIVITQFERFGSEKEVTDIKSLRRSLINDYRDVFVTIIFFSPIDDNWKYELHERIKGLTK